MKKLLASIGACAFATLALAQDQALMTMQDAVQLAQKNAFSIRLAVSRRDKARDTERAAWNSLGPRVDLSSSYSYQKTEFSPFASGTGGGNFGPEGWQNYKNATLSLSQNIDINGLAAKQARALKQQRQAQDENIATEDNALQAQVRSKFLVLLQAQGLLKVREAAVKSSETRLANAVIKQKAGSIPQFEVLRLESELQAAIQNRVTATADVITSRQDLNNTMGVPIQTEYVAQGVDVIMVAEEDPAKLVEIGLKNRPELRQSNYFVASLENIAKVATRGYKPSMAVQATHTQYFDPPAGGTKSFSQIAANLSVPLWDSGVAKQDVKAAQRDVEQAMIQREQIELGIAYDVRTAYVVAQSAREAIDLSKKNVEVAREALRLAQLRYDEGVGILLDVIAAQADLTSAEVNQVNTLYRYLQAFSSLQRAVGSDLLMLRPDQASTTPTTNKDKSR